MILERFFMSIYYAGIVYGRAKAYCWLGACAAPAYSSPLQLLSGLKETPDASLSSDPNRSGERTISTP